MDAKQLTDEIKYYVGSDFLNQAIFVNGKWGTGKTYFFKNELKDKLKIENYLMLSLYGINSLEEIDKFLFLNLYPIAKINEKVKNKLGKETSYFFKKITGSILSKFNIDFSDLDYKEFINPKDVLLVLDDFERASISSIDILGYINNLTENYNMKVILVGYEKEVEFNKSSNDYLEKYKLILDHKLNQKWIKNQKELKTSSSEDIHNNLTEEQLSVITKDFFSKTDKYNIVKEKTIIKTIDFENDILSAMKEITSNTKLDVKLKALITQDLDFYHTIMRKLETYNLRSYIFFLNMISRIYGLIKPKFETHELYNILLKTIMDSIFYISFDYKAGNRISTILYKNEEGVASIRHEMTYIKSFEIINNYIENNILDKNELINYFKDYLDKLTIEEENQISKLSRFHIMRDEEIIDLIKNIRESIKQEKVSYKVFPTVINYFGTLEAVGFKEVYLNATYKDMRNSINNQIDELETLQYRDSFISPINDSTKRILKKYYNYLSSKISERTEKEFLIKITDEQWAKELSKEISCKENIFQKYHEFFNFLDIDKITDKLKISYSKDIIIFRSSIRQIYNFSNLEDIYKKDLQSLTDFLEKVKKINAADKISQYNISFLINDLEEYLVKLKRKPKNG